MAWNDAVLVNGGVSMLREILAGEVLTLDNGAGGAGAVSASSLMAQTSLLSQKQSFSIVGVENVANGKKINIQISNIGLASGYNMTQIGIWAHVGSGESKLLAIIQDNIGIAIPSQEEMPDFAMNFYAVIAFSNEASFQLTIDPSVIITKVVLDAAIFEAVEGKVDAEDGKGLSSNDYTDGEKAKLEGIAENATNYVHPSNATTRHMTDGEKAKIAEMDAALEGKADLGEDGKVSANQLPSYVDDVLEFSALSAFPKAGEPGKIYIALDSNKTYRWGGSTYVEVSQGAELGETASTAYRGDRGKVAYDHSDAAGNPHGTTAEQVGVSEAVAEEIWETPPENPTVGGALEELSKNYLILNLTGPIDKRYPDLTFPAMNGVAASDGNGNVLFGGSQLGDQNVVDKYTKDGVRTTLTPLSVARGYLAAAKDGNGNVLFGGGRISNTPPYATVDRYTKDGVRTTLTSLSDGRSDLAAATDGNGSVLFGGGSGTGKVDKYTKDGVRTTLTPLSVARAHLAAAKDGNGNVLFGGGFRGSDGASYANVDRYTKNGARTTLTPLSVGRSNLAAASGGDGSVLFGGGIVNNSASSDVVDKYTKDGVRTTLTALSVGRRFLNAATDGNGNIVFGGGYGGYRTVDLRVSGSVAGIIIPAYHSYKFGDNPFQTVLKDTLVVPNKTPITCYIKLGGETINI